MGKRLIACLITYILYKTKLKTRRRFSILERFLSRFGLSKLLFDRIYVIIPLFGLLCSILTSFGVYYALRHVQFTIANACETWRWFYFLVIVSGCLGGLRVTGRTLFPEDTQILARLPLGRKQLPLIVFAEHLTTTAFNLLLFFISVWVPLLLVTKAFFSLELMVLSTTVVLVFALVLFLFVGLLLRVTRFYLLRRAAFWKTALLQAAAVFVLTAGSYKLTGFLFSDIPRALERIPPDAFGSNNPEAAAGAIAQLLNAVLSRGGELAQLVSTLFHFPYWPHNLSTGLLQEFNTAYLGPLALELVLILIPTAILLQRYQIETVDRIPPANKVDQKLCDLVLRLGSVKTKACVILRKNLLLTTRHLEIIRMNLFSLFGGGLEWIMVGSAAGIGHVLAVTHVGVYWNVLVGSWGVMLLLVTFQLRTYGHLRFLVSIDGEGRNISLLRLGGVTLPNLYTSRVQLLRIITLPALALAVLVLAVKSRFAAEQWLVILISTGFICLNVPKLLLLAGVSLPRFDTPHFEESGSFIEQRMVDSSCLAALALVVGVLLVPVLIFCVGTISFLTLTLTIVGYLVVASTGIHGSVRRILAKTGASMQQAESVL